MEGGAGATPSSSGPTIPGPSWVRHAIWWHVYPLGFTGAEQTREAGAPVHHRLGHLQSWLDYAVEHDPQPPAARGVDQGVEVGVVTKSRIDAEVVGRVVAVCLRSKDRPQGEP